MNKRKARATVKAVLTLLDKAGSVLLSTSNRESLRNLHELSNFDLNEAIWKEFNQSSVRDGINRLLRRGDVEICEHTDGVTVSITEKGRREVLKYQIDTMSIEKPYQWDGKWRLVFFDVEEMDRGKRDKFRTLLNQMGLRRMQRSVFVYPYPLDKQIKFIREVIGIPHSVKLVVAEQIENDEDLRDMFLI